MLFHCFGCFSTAWHQKDAIRGDEKASGNSGLHTFLPYGFHAGTGVVEDAATGGAASGGQEAEEDAGDVTSEAELLRSLHPSALYTEAEASEAGKDDGLPFGEFLHEDVLHVGDHRQGGALRDAAALAGFGGDLVEGYFALTHGFSEVFAVGAAALDVVPDKFDVYCHKFFDVFCPLCHFCF